MTVLVTGGTGSFGKHFVDYVLKNTRVKKLIVFSRDEMKQWELSQKNDDPRLRFFLGDVRDLSRVRMAMRGVELVVHAAALKIVPTAEYNPFEAIKTNITGAMNVIESAIDAGVSKVVALSTDKACEPANLYGATKLVSDKVFVAANSYSGAAYPAFSVVRYGNVIDSRGSIIPFLKSIRSGDPSPLTDPRMTRFMISLDDGVALVLRAFSEMVGGEIFVKKTPSIRIVDLIKAIRPESEVEIIGIRPGEKLHEIMVAETDARLTYEFDGYYKILSDVISKGQRSEASKNGTPVSEDFVYSSELNTHWITANEIEAFLGV